MNNDKKDKTISIRLSAEMLDKLRDRALTEQKDRTEVIRDALSIYLEMPESNLEIRVSNLEEKTEFWEKERKQQQEKVNKLQNQISVLTSILQGKYSEE